MKKKRIALCAVLAAGILCGFLISDVVNKEHSKTGFAMDTAVTVKIRGGSYELTDEVLERVSDLDRRHLSRTSEDSEVYAINSLHSLEDISDITVDAVNVALEVGEKSGGAFDVTLGAISDLWNFKAEQPSVPDEASVKAALALSGVDKLTLDGDDVLLEPGAVLDLGAVGKGIACDEARNILKKSRAKSAVVSVGGSVLLYGGREYTVGIRNPLGAASQYAGTLKLKDTCVSTSGSYERFFYSNGVRYHHILDTASGFPVSNSLMSVTVVCKSGALSDALSTACFALGLEDGMRLAREFDAEAVFITEDMKIYLSPGLKKAFSPDKSGEFVLAE